MSWNYRLCTKIEGKEGSTRWRSYCIKEVCYTDDVPDGYADKNVLEGFESVADLLWTVAHLKSAFEKPILDLDNFPNEYKEPSE